MSTEPPGPLSNPGPPPTAPHAIPGPYAPVPPFGGTPSTAPVSSGDRRTPEHTAPRLSSPPSPVGLLAAGAGLILLCASILLPQASISFENMDEYGYFGMPSTGEAFAVGTSSVLLIVALLTAVGLSAHHAPEFRWPTRLGAVGLAALTAAFAYHPITVAQQTLQVYEDANSAAEYAADTTPEITVAADSGLYLTVLGVALLAASAFLMRPGPRPPTHGPMPPAPATGPGIEPGITVTPG